VLSITILTTIYPLGARITMENRRSTGQLNVRSRPFTDISWWGRQVLLRSCLSLATWERRVL